MAPDPGPDLWYSEMAMDIDMVALVRPKNSSKHTHTSGADKCQIFAPAVSKLNEIKSKKNGISMRAKKKEWQTF